jgi:hypothetical protein
MARLVLALGLAGVGSADADTGRPKRRCRPWCSTCQRCAKGRCPADGTRDAAPCAGGLCLAGACVPDPGSCPSDKPTRCGIGLCRPCCIDDQCGPFSGKVCHWDAGAVCVCRSGNVCIDAICWSCCHAGDYALCGKAPADGFFCNADHLGACPGSQSARRDVSSSTRWYCAAQRPQTVPLRPFAKRAW